ncbi:MAG: hypothetical protein EXS43_07555 [Opitutus sp.]|nr:hypothetical protein [Opitutus sp.]
MSTVQEVQEALKGMSPEDRTRVKAFLLHLTRANDPEHKAEMTRCLQAMEQGGGVPQSKLEQLHEDLCKKGL